MAFMGMIFFLFGFVTTFNITLADKFKAVFELSNFQAQLVNGAFFFTYFLLSFAAGGIIKKIGYKAGVILGLVLVALGSFLFFPAAKALSFPFFLFAIFIMAGGVVFLQVAANPYVTALGPSETASGRLNLTQALNSIATYLAPLVASAFVFKAAAGALSPKPPQSRADPLPQAGSRPSLKGASSTRLSAAAGPDFLGGVGAHAPFLRRQSLSLCLRAAGGGPAAGDWPRPLRVRRPLAPGPGAHGHRHRLRHDGLCHPAGAQDPGGTGDRPGGWGGGP